MKKVQDAFTQISLNMIKTINKYANKSESEIAKDLGISDLYNRLKGKTDSNAEESVTTDDSLNEVEELDLEASGNLSYMEAVKKAVKDIKERKTIEKEEKKKLDKAMNENDKIYLHTYLENNGYTLVKIPGKGYRYFPNEGIMDVYGDLLDKNNVERIPVPFGEQGTENEKTGADFLKDLENNAKFEGEKKDLNKLNPVEDNNNTTIVIPPAKNNNNKQYFEEEGFIDLLGGDSSVNNSNIKIKDACLLKMDGC